MELEPLKSLEPQQILPLDPTWSVLDREPGMDDLAEQAGPSVLKKMKEDLKIFPFQDRDQQDRLFLARHDLPKYGETSRYPEAMQEGSVAFIDFLAGFPIDCVEMLVAIGEYSSKAKEGEDNKVKVFEGGGKVVPPIPKGEFFKWPEKDKILLNLTAIATKNVGKILAKNLEGEPKPASPKFWFRVQLTAGTEDEPKKWPVPGEFLGLGVRMFPGMYWGKQLSSPFVWSGNWVDTVYLTSGEVTEVIVPTDEIPYSTYKIRWRKGEGTDDEGIVIVSPSDFATYEVGDRCTILKDVTTTKTNQLWKDEDQKAWGDSWQIIPLSYYGGL